MSRPSFGGVGALREGDHEHQRGRHHLRQEAHVLAPRAPAYARIIKLTWSLLCLCRTQMSNYINENL